jgi:mannan endo-1,4-beta-mannosidase
MKRKYIIQFYTLLAMTIPSFSGEGFTVSGTKLIDACGNEFIINGINNPHIWYQEEAYLALNQIAKLNVNCNRIVWETRGKVDSLEMIILKTIELEMIPMVELHDVTGSPATSGLMEMVGYYTRPDVKEMLLKYEKYLLLNIANEWGDHTVTGEHWFESYRQAVDTLRTAGYRFTIVIDAPGWGQNLEPIQQYGNALLQADPNKNLLFSVHMYGSWNEAMKIKKELDKAHQANLPLIVGEFGYNYREGDNNLHCTVDHRMILTTCQELGYGYMPWSWAGNNAENAWLDLAEYSDWSTLTWWGREVFNGEQGITATAKKASVFAE